MTIAPPKICRDPDDNNILALAFVGSANLVVNGDDDLLTVGTMDTCRIVPVREALELLAGRRE